MAAKSQCRVMSDRHCMARCSCWEGKDMSTGGPTEKRQDQGRQAAASPPRATSLQSRFPDQGAATFCPEM